VHTILSKYCCN